MRKKVAIIAVIVIVALGAGAYVYNAQFAPKPQHQSSKQQPSGDVTSSETAGGKTYLIDQSGRPLYTYGQDKPGVSNCSGTCADSWPPYLVLDPTAKLPTNITIVTTQHGKQYAYKDMPLYTFVSDQSGNATGDGVGGFSLVRP